MLFAKTGENCHLDGTTAEFYISGLYACESRAIKASLCNVLFLWGAWAMLTSLWLSMVDTFCWFSWDEPAKGAQSDGGQRR
jgi:hypothetical protein